jgi:hypothetical protein
VWGALVLSGLFANALNLILLNSFWAGPDGQPIAAAVAIVIVATVLVVLGALLVRRWLPGFEIVSPTTPDRALIARALVAAVAVTVLVGVVVTATS